MGDESCSNGWCLKGPGQRALREEENYLIRLGSVREREEERVLIESLKAANVHEATGPGFIGVVLPPPRMGWCGVVWGGGVARWRGTVWRCEALVWCRERALVEVAVEGRALHPCTVRGVELRDELRSGSGHVDAGRPFPIELGGCRQC